MDFSTLEWDDAERDAAMRVLGALHACTDYSFEEGDAPLLRFLREQRCRVDASAEKSSGSGSGGGGNDDDASVAQWPAPVRAALSACDAATFARALPRHSGEYLHWIAALLLQANLKRCVVALYASQPHLLHEALFLSILFFQC